MMLETKFQQPMRCSGDGCFRLHSMVLNATYLKASFCPLETKDQWSSSHLYLLARHYVDKEKSLQNFSDITILSPCRSSIGAKLDLYKDKSLFVLIKVGNCMIQFSEFPSANLVRFELCHVACSPLGVELKLSTLILIPVFPLCVKYCGFCLELLFCQFCLKFCTRSYLRCGSLE